MNGVVTRIYPFRPEQGSTGEPVPPGTIVRIVPGPLRRLPSRSPSGAAPVSRPLYEIAEPSRSTMPPAIVARFWRLAMTIAPLAAFALTLVAARRW